MIRWGRLAFLLTPLLLIWAGAHFFLDRGIRRAIETAGSAAVGARVDVAGVRTSFWRLSATISGLAVTDPDQPMTNLVEIGTLRLKLQLKPLFWKKFIVDRAEILGIRTGTSRKSSGALPQRTAKKEKPSALTETAKELSGAAVANLKDAYDPQKLVAPENLASYQKALAERDQLTQLADKWKSRSQGLDVKGLSTRGQTFVDKVKNEKFSGVEGVAKAQLLLKEGQALKSDLSTAQKEVKSLGSELTTEVASAKAALKEIDRLRRQDIDKAVGQVKAGFSTEGLTKGLLGPVWFSKLEKLLGWVEKGRTLTGGGDDKKEAPPPPPVREGRDVPFPFHHRWPAVHLGRAALSGETPGGLAYQGTLSDVGSDPALIGKPTVLELAGRSGERALNLLATLDLTTKIPSESLKTEYTGLPLAGMKLGSINNSAVSIAGGRGTVKANVVIRGPDLGGTIDLEGSALKLEQSSPKTDRLSAAIRSVFEKLTQAQISIGVSGTIKAPQFALNSSIDNQLRGAMKGAMDQEIAKLRADLEKQINDMVGKETEKLSALVDKNAGAALEKLNLGDKELGDVEGKIKKTLDDLAENGTKGLKIPNLKGLFRKK
ncbi:MAG: TIGR03545 family protein [Elusimicrobia bacterium]|nr:TIGR03545 family protein [Elusimicrobiota bacterium]